MRDRLLPSFALFPGRGGGIPNKPVRVGTARMQPGERFKPAGDERNLSFEPYRPESALRDEIIARLRQLPDGEGERVEIVVRAGDVTLSGIVADRYIKYLAEEIVANTRGVHNVHNKLEAAHRDRSRYGDADAKHREMRARRERRKGLAGPPRAR
jgi:hypothetical protein